MRTLIIPLCFGAALALPLIAPATESADVDPVSASFTRMLEHAPVTAAPASPTAREDDPLYSHLAAVLWERQHAQCAFAGSEIAAMNHRSVAQ